MPRLSDSMEEGTVIRRLSRETEDVESGDELVEIETDKATMAYETAIAGTPTVAVGKGETASVGATIAWIGAGGRTIARLSPKRSAPVYGAAKPPGCLSR